MSTASHKPPPPAIDLVDQVALDSWPDTLRRCDLPKFLDASAQFVDLVSRMLTPSDPEIVRRMITPLAAELRARARELRSTPTGNA